MLRAMRPGLLRTSAISAARVLSVQLLSLLRAWSARGSTAGHPLQPGRGVFAPGGVLEPVLAMARPGRTPCVHKPLGYRRCLEI